MKKLLVTGFGIFPPVKRNITADIAKAVKGNHFGVNIVSGELKVSWKEAGPALLKLIKDHQPDALLSLGIKQGNQIYAERFAHNENGYDEDGYGKSSPQRKVVEKGSRQLSATLPLNHLIHEINLGQGSRVSPLPAYNNKAEPLMSVTSSMDAGDYLCNLVMYQGLHATAKNCKYRGFFHLGLNRDFSNEHQALQSGIFVVQKMAEWLAAQKAV